jgi:N-methylhydantoinase B
VNLTDRCRYAPFGLFGGGTGKTGRTIIQNDSSEATVHSKSTTRLSEGNVISFQVSGGGGYGDARERDVEAVRRDVLRGCVSIEAARRDYGVVIDPTSKAVDLSATDAARSSMSS